MQIALTTEGPYWAAVLKVTITMPDGSSAESEISLRQLYQEMKSAADDSQDA